MPRSRPTPVSLPSTGGGGCFLDGKLSAVFFRERVWIYARANLAAEGGARHVQVTCRSNRHPCDHHLISLVEIA